MSYSVSYGMPLVEISGLDSRGVIVEVRGIRLDGPESTPLVQKLSLYLPAHSLVAVAGFSDAGTSALLRALAGVGQPADGQILIDGSSLYENRAALIDNIAYVSSAMAPHPALTVGEALNAAASLRLPRAIKAGARKSQVEATLEALGLKADQNQRISRLPAIKRFRAGIAAEIVAHPAIVMIDRPELPLAPGEEQSLVTLYKNLTGQGTTVIFATHSSRIMSQADMLILLDTAGSLVWMGPPGEIRRYLDGMRAKLPPMPPQPGVEDLLSLLASADSAAAGSWAATYQASSFYAKYVDDPTNRKKRDLMLEEHPLSSLRGKTTELKPPARVPRSSGVQQYLIFLARSYRLLARDPFGLIFGILAPVLLAAGVLVTASPQLYDPMIGNAGTINLILSALVFLTLLIASFCQVRDAAVEDAVFRRERQLSAGVFPYVLAKASLVIPIAIYQGLVLTIAYFAAVGMAGGFSNVPRFLLTVILAAVAGGMIGVLASALAHSLQSGIAWALLLILPQFFLSGSFIPFHDLSPAVQAVSTVLPAHYAFQALVKSSGYGSDVARDACWALPASQRQAMLDVQKANCICMGSNIFATCNFPGIRQPVTMILDQPQPVQPTPDNAINQIPVQPILRQGETLDQYAGEISQYTLQLEKYQGVVSSYLSSLLQFTTTITAWTKLQSYAIGSAEARIANEITDYGPIYSVNLRAHWLSLALISLVLGVLFMGIQFRKGRV